jgi:hypothetical protein
MGRVCNKNVAGRKEGRRRSEIHVDYCKKVRRKEATKKTKA